MMSENEKQALDEIYSSRLRADSTPFAKAHRKIKSTKGKFKSNMQPAKKKRKK